MERWDGSGSRGDEAGLGGDSPSVRVLRPQSGLRSLLGEQWGKKHFKERRGVTRVVFQKDNSGGECSRKEQGQGREQLGAKLWPRLDNVGMGQSAGFEQRIGDGPRGPDK